VTVEPPSDSYGDRVGDLLRAALDLNPDCCGNDPSRGRLCQYHQGYEDGLWAAFAWVMEADGE